MKKVALWVSVSAVSAVVGWLFCFISALVVFRKFQPVDLTLPEDKDDE